MAAKKTAKIKKDTIENIISSAQRKAAEKAVRSAMKDGLQAEAYSIGRELGKKICRDISSSLAKDEEFLNQLSAMAEERIKKVASQFIRNIRMY